MGKAVTHYMIREEVHNIPDKTLPWSHKCLYGRLWLRCNHKNQSWWSNEKLAKDMQIEKRTLQKWCRRLEKLGLIEIDRSQVKTRTNNISMTEPTFDEWLELGVPREVLEELRGARLDTPPVSDGTPMGDRLDTPVLKLKVKTKSKTGGAATGRATIGNIWGDDDVVASGERAVEISKKRGALPTVQILNGVSVVPENEEDFNTIIARWTPRQWAKEFVRMMDEQGYEVAFHKYKTLAQHLDAIRDHLLNQGFPRLKIYRFLLDWFPNAYTDICSSVFKKSPEDFMFSVSWMEPRLAALVRLFEEEGDEPEWAPKVTVMD